jgi:GTP-binding protein
LRRLWAPSLRILSRVGPWRDLILDQQEIVLIPGGKGGKGNQHFATSTNRAPRFAQPGLPGKTLKLKLTLKLLADVGLVGLPNAGKSTLLSRLTEARPKVGSYPFTTLVPNLGVMTFDDGRTLVVADIPGLVEGARIGRGLGHRFLRHIERTQFLLHLVDPTHSSKNHVLSDFLMLREEMSAYSAALAHKPYVVVINKIDLFDPERQDIKTLRRALDKIGTKSMCISALTGEGLNDLIRFISANCKVSRKAAKPQKVKNRLPVFLHASLRLCVT